MPLTRCGGGLGADGGHSRLNAETPKQVLVLAERAWLAGIPVLPTEPEPAEGFEAALPVGRAGPGDMSATAGQAGPEEPAESGLSLAG